MPQKQNKIQLIETVKEFPFLYDRLNEENKNKQKVDAKWVELAELCGFQDAIEAKATWENMVKARNRCKDAAAKGSNSKPYLYDENLSFLDEYYPYKRFRQNEEGMSYNQELLNLAMQNGQDYRLDDDQISGLSRSRSEERRLSEERRFGSYGPPEIKRPRIAQESNHSSNNVQLKPIFPMEASQQNGDNLGEAFGKTVGIALNRLRGKAQMQAQVEIMQVLLKYTSDD